jgi:hypothetical protein
MRDADPPVHYLVGTPRGQLTQLEQAFLDKPWQVVREQVSVELLKPDAEAQDTETYEVAGPGGRWSHSGGPAIGCSGSVMDSARRVGEL